VTWKEICTLAGSFERNATSHAMKRVGLLISSPTRFAASYLAGLAAGLVLAPLDPRATTAELTTQVAELAISDLLVDESTIGKAGSIVDETVGVLEVRGSSQLHPLARRRPIPVVSASCSQVVLRTSGSSGRPKLVPLSEPQLLYAARQVVTHHRFTLDDRGYCPLPPFHVNAQVIGILSTLVAGGSLILDTSLRADDLWATVLESAATWCNFVPAILAALGEVKVHGDLGRVRFVRSASSPLPESIRLRFTAATGLSVLETYGMTEASGQITANTLAPGARRYGSVGLPVGIELRVVGDDGVAVGPGSVGTVEIRGPSVITSYLPAAGSDPPPSPVDADGWLNTGDVGWRDGDGFLFLLGRRDDLINRGGEKFSPLELEAVLLEEPLVEAAAVVGWPHESLGAEPVAFVVLRSGANGMQHALVEALHERCTVALSRYKRPVRIVVVDSLPTGATGKLSRRALLLQESGAA
jgi:oxalate---CoA ligase